MTVFPDGRKERLHGHNYTVSVAVDLAEISFDKLLDFGAIKRAVAGLCGEWRERTLVAELNPETEIRRADGELEIRIRGQRYVLPEGDVLLLPADNTTVEELSRLWVGLLATRLAAELAGGAAVGLEVTVEESPGQGASAYVRLDGTGGPPGHPT